MTKKEKIAALDGAITTSTRDNGDVFSHFSDSAPKELHDLFLEHYEVRDNDYEIFGSACGILVDIYNDEAQETDGNDFTIDAIYERSSDQASVYTAVRLSYLDIGNQEDIGSWVRANYTDIADACAYWYDNQVEQAAFIINEWVNA